ncbi:MAG: putative DNA-binding domain-containing protein, partial [Betaproteobacteria bacterium]|nr:putative DNA-binding domain-containing protein [Betaproteobacteria bacterium]
MPSLPELQGAFATAILAGDDAGNDASHVSHVLLAHCAGTPEQVARGLAAYRRGVLGNLSAAVLATYPVLAAIVGADFLAAAARRYARERPSRSGDLNAYGGDFDQFLEGYAPAAPLPYLPAVARLEWLIQEVSGATEGPAQDLAVLAATAPGGWGELRFQLDPAHRCLAEDWPVARIWEVNQPDYAGDFEVDFARRQTVLVHRRSQGIAVEALPPGEHALLVALGAGETLATAVQAAAQ